MWGTKTKKLITHNGVFHTDDIFACATLITYLERNSLKFELVRTRDKELIASGDFVFDVGDVYDEEKNRFDHHQKGGAGRRANGIEYSSLGLIWKKFGRELCASDRVWEIIDKDLVSPIDAGDNGQELFDSKHEVFPYLLQNAMGLFGRTWKEDPEKNNEYFLQAVEVAKKILQREIKWAEDAVDAEDKVLRNYEDAKDKRIVILDKDYPYQVALSRFPEPLFVVYERMSDHLWAVRAVRLNFKTFKNRKDLPTSWAGLRDEAMANVSGVEDAVFCHRGLFMALAKSKSGALALAERAVSL